MSGESLFWVYLVNAVLLIDHEIDSAYWREWVLFRPLEKAGIDGFLLLHLPLLLLALYGLVLVYERNFWGLVVSIVFSLAGLFTFCFHFYHLRRGREEFDTPLSRGIIIAILVCSLVQGVMSLALVIG